MCVNLDSLAHSLNTLTYRENRDGANHAKQGSNVSLGTSTALQDDCGLKDQASDLVFCSASAESGTVAI